MRIRFTKMQGAGNDFIVLDETRGALKLSSAQYRFLAHRQFGVGADQILSVRPSPGPGVDFEYVIHNADGGEVEQCGNGARCFMRFVHDKGLTKRESARVRTLSGVIEPRLNADGRVTVDMGAPAFEPAALPFDAAGLSPHASGNWEKWHLALGTSADSTIVSVALVSMGNPHAVQEVADVDSAPVTVQGPLDRTPPALSEPRECRLHAGGRPLAASACASGNAAPAKRWPAAPAPALPWLRASGWDAWTARSTSQTRGGLLTIEWDGLAAAGSAPVLMTGPAVTVFEGELELPDTL